MSVAEERARLFIKLAQRCTAIRNSTASWAVKYEAVFSLAEEIHDTGLMPSYYDPDTSYEDDTYAFVGAIETKASELLLAWGPPGG